MTRSFGALLLAAVVLAPAPSLAQDAKTVRLIVPFAAGGPADALARAVGPGMSTALGQSVVIDNRGGAGGVLGVDAVAKAAPDGTTIGLGGFGAMTVLPFMRPAPYDVLRDLAPITLVGRNSGVLVTHPKRGFKTVADLVAFAKANPKKVNFASAGTGTSIHLSGELFASASGIQLVHVPYAKGAAPAITDLLGGHVDMMLPDISGVLEHVRSGALVALAVTGEKRSPQLPDVPTMGEAGYPKVVSETWFGLIAPAKTPAGDAQHAAWRGDGSAEIAGRHQADRAAGLGGCADDPGRVPRVHRRGAGQVEARDRGRGAEAINMQYDPRSEPHTLKHNPATALVVPRPIGWITTIGPTGVVNLAPYSFFNIVASNPPFVIFSSSGRKHSQANAEIVRRVRVQHGDLRAAQRDEPHLRRL